VNSNPLFLTLFFQLNRYEHPERVTVIDKHNVFHLVINQKRNTPETSMPIVSISRKPLNKLSDCDAASGLYIFNDLLVKDIPQKNLSATLS